MRTIDALKKSSDLAEELARRMTPAQLLEAALRKVEGQDLATLTYAIKRLCAYREKLAPVTFQDRQAMLEVRNAWQASHVPSITITSPFPTVPSPSTADSEEDSSGGTTQLANTHATTLQIT